MIRQSPSQRYIRYLLVHPKRWTNEQVLDACLFAQLPALGGWYLNHLRGEITLPEPFFPRDKNHQPSVRWLLQNQLFRLFHPDDAVRRAYDILKAPRVKEFVEAMLISHAPHLAIADTLTRHRGFPCVADDVARYAFYFWDVSLVSTTELRALLQMESGNAALSADTDVQRQHEPLQKTFYNDPRRTAAELPFSPITALMAQMRLGVMPAKYELAKVLEATRFVGAMRALESAYANNPHDSEKFANYTAGVARITETLESIIKPDEDLQKQLAKIALRTDVSQIPYVHQLTGGAHTTELQPIRDDDDFPGTDSDDDDPDSGDPDGSGSDPEGFPSD